MTSPPTSPSRPWSEPARTLVEFLNLESSVIAVNAHNQLSFSGDYQGWAVLRGTVSVFFIHSDGSRAHLFTTEAGGWLPNLSDRGTQGDIELAAVPSSDCLVAALSHTQLHAAMNAVEERQAASQLIDLIAKDFIEAVGDLEERGVANSPIPINAVRIEAGQEYDIPAGTSFYSASDTTLWATVPPGSISLLGKDMESDEVPLCFPLGREPLSCPIVRHHCWTAQEPIHLQPLTAPQRLSVGPIFLDIRNLKAFTIEIVLELQNRQSRTILERLKETLAEKELGLDGSVQDLGSVLSTGKSTATDISQTPVARAIELASRRTGFSFKLKEGQSQAFRDSNDPVRALADCAGILTREVTLASPWWRQDHGSFLAFTQEGRVPLALIQNPNTHSYTAINPVTSEQTPVTEGFAATLDPVVHSFFRPLGQEERTPFSLFKMAITGSKRDAWRIVTLIVLSGILSLVLPIVTGWIMDPVIPNGELSMLWVLTLGLAIAGIAGVGFSYTQSIAMMRIEGRMQNIVQTAVWDRLLKVPVNFFRQFTAGDLVNRSDGIDAMRRFVTTTFLTTLMHSVSALFSLGLMFYYRWQLAIAVLIVAIVYVLIAIPVGLKFINTTRIMMKLNGQLQGVVLQLLTAVPKIRLAGAEQGAFNQWTSRFAEVLRLTYKQRVLNIILAVAKTALTSVATLVLIGLLAWEGGVLFVLFSAGGAEAATVTTGPSLIPLNTAKFMSFNVAMGQFIAAAFGLTELGIKVLNIAPLYERIQPILDAQTETTAETQPIENLRGSIEFKEVTFTYPEQKKPVLSNLSFEVKAGQMVAIVGPSGGGKSTIVRMLLGFEKPDSGSIFVDRLPLTRVDKHSFRKQIGVVLQESRLISGSIFSNIAAGADTTEEEAWAAAEKVGLADDIHAMPMGMQTYISDGANTISGGQKQRITAARALIKNPRVIIFDEATSALDNTTQAHVTESIAAMNASRIVIAHRLSTILSADYIYVLDQGHMVESGTYDELMAINGFFANLAKRQLHTPSQS